MTKELRVLQAMAGPNPGGAEEFFVRLARALRDAGVSQHVVVKRGAYAARRLREQAIEPEELAFGGLFDLTTKMRFRRSIERHQPHVVLTWMNRATRFCPRDLKHASFVHAGRLGGYYNLKYYRGCHHLIANTHDIVDYVTDNGWSANAVRYLPNFVDQPSAQPVARAELDTPADAPLLLALGRLHQNKAFDVLLDALVDLPGTYLWLAGSGGLDASLRARARSLGINDRVRFLGWREDTAALYAAADLYVCSSRVEPLGNVVIEAWANGRPVVAAAASGPASLIEDGKNGVLVPIDNAAMLAAAIERILASPELATSLIDGGRTAYERDFTEAAVVKQYLNFFSAIAA